MGLIEVTGMDGTGAFIDPHEVRQILPAIAAGQQLPREQDGIAIVGRDDPEVKGSIVAFKTPGSDQLVVNEHPATLAERINEARRG